MAEVTATPSAASVLTTETPAAPAPAVTETPASAAPAAWHDSFDADTKGWLQNRGYDKLDEKAALNESIKGFRNVEKLIGAPAEQILKLPGKDAKPEEYGVIYDKLGRPADPSKYDLKFGTDTRPVDPAFDGFAKGLFHKVGLSQSQAAEVAKEFTAYTDKVVNDKVSGYKADLQKQEVELKTEWGGGYDQQVGVAKQFIHAAGIKGEQIDQLEQVMGFAGVMKFFNQLGSKIGESKYVDNNESGGFGGLSKEAAATKIGQLRNDVEFAKKLGANDAATKAEWDRLHVIAYG